MGRIEYFIRTSFTKPFLENGIKCVEINIRWIQNRTEETWWSEDEDLEFDTVQRFQVLDGLSEDQRVEAKDKAFELPIDIRFKLGCLRLGLKQKELRWLVLII